jgi:hypothetical protein
MTGQYSPQETKCQVELYIWIYPMQSERKRKRCLSLKYEAKCIHVCNSVNTLNIFT